MDSIHLKKKRKPLFYLTRPQSSLLRKERMGWMMGRRKGEGRNDWQILSRKVVRRVEKLCEVVFVIFFRRSCS